MRSFITTFLTGVLALAYALLATAQLPSITSPTGSTSWKIGKNAQITWEKVTVPDAAPIAYVDLYTTSYGDGPLFVSRLAGNLDATTGSVTVTVPQVPIGGSYIVMLGQYGHSSDSFTIGV